MKRQRKLTQQDLRLLRVQPGLQAVRYPAGAETAEVKQLTAEQASGAYQRSLSGSGGTTESEQRGD